VTTATGMKIITSGTTNMFAPDVSETPARQAKNAAQAARPPATNAGASPRVALRSAYPSGNRDHGRCRPYASPASPYLVGRQLRRLDGGEPADGGDG
jgi:hypothetical protein